MQIYYLMLYFFVYGFLGWCTEVAYATTKQRKFVNRGFLNGPICPIYGVGVTVVVYFLTPYKDNLILLYALSTVLVTVLEGLTGYLMDKIFHHKWWDYTNQPLNIGGYVCLIFSLVWGVACVLIVRVIHPVIHKILTFIPHTLGLIMLAVLEICIFVDLYVTAAGILKLNHQLETMAKIAAELHEISDKLGENIHEGMMDTMEATEERRKKLEAATEGSRRKLSEGRTRIGGTADEARQQLQARSEELRKKYEELSGQGGAVSRRLMKAFPRMESRQYKETFNELREKLRLKEKMKRKKFLWGLLLGSLYFLILFAVSAALAGGLPKDLVHMGTTLGICMAAGTLGGMMS